MSYRAEKRARAEAVLGELAELGLMAAREIAIRLRESEDAEETVTLASALQKISRGVRLTIALDFKLDRDAARDARDEVREAERIEAARIEAEAEAEDDGAIWTPPAHRPDPVQARKGRIGALLHRLLWNESEGDGEEFEVLQEDLSARLDEAALSPDFEALPIETLARRMIADMKLSGELTLSLCEPPRQGAAASPPPVADTG